MRFTTRRGSEAPNAALPPGEARRLREAYEEIHNARELARRTGYNRETVRRVVNHQTYLDDDS